MGTQRSFAGVCLAVFAFTTAAGAAAEPLAAGPAPFSTAERKSKIRRLEAAIPVEAQMAGGQVHLYEISVERGQYLHAVAEQKGVDVALSLLSPDGKILAETDNLSGAYALEEISLVVESSGLDRLEVRSTAREGSVGRYVLRIELRAATPQDDQRVQAERAFGEGVRLYRQATGDSQRQAIAKYQEAASLWKALSDRFHQSNALSDLADVHHSLADNRRALELYFQALTLRQEVADSRGESETLTSIGGVYQDLGEPEKALDYSQRALPLAKAAGDRIVEASALYQIGSIAGLHGQKQIALDNYNQSLPLWRGVGDRESEAKTLSAIGVLLADLGEHQRALDHYNQARSLLRTSGDRRGEGVVLNNIGLIYDVLGEKQKALALLSQALALHQAAGNRRSEAYTLSNIGGVYDGLGEKQKALEYFGRALPLRRALGDRKGEAITLNRLGVLHRSLGEPQKALEYFEEALRVRRAIGDRIEESTTLTNIGLAYASLGETEKALDNFGQALSLQRSMGDRSRVAITLVGIARAQADRGNLLEARQNALEALALTESVRSTIASPDLRASFLASAQEAFEFYTSLLMKLHHLDPNAGFAAEALEASERARARSLLELLIEARAPIREGVDPQLLEQERTLQARLAAQHELQIKLLSGVHGEEQAVKAAEEIAALTIDYEQVQARIRATSPRYAALTQPRPLPLAEIQKQVLDDPDTLLLEYSLGKEKSFLWAVTSSSMISRELPGRAELENATRHVYELLTARNAHIKFETPSQRRSRIRRADAEYPQAAKALSQTLLAPVAGLLGRKRLLIVSDGALQYVPFSTLPEPGGGAEPLVAGHEIVSLPSASTLAVLRRELIARPVPPKTIAILADPVFDREDRRVTLRLAGKALPGGSHSPPSRPSSAVLESDLVRSARDAGLAGEGTLRIPRLPFTRREAQEILALARPSERKAALDFDASHASATDPELGQYRFVHFATHAWLDAVHPELSGIVLSLVDRQGREREGFLSASEVFNLHLPVELVVLSGCRTGLGKEIRGEGLVGISRGFMYAGAARVLVSLWDVNDQATADLMSRFYRAMLGKERLRPAAALRKAQIAMAKGKDKSAPYYWAGFILQGEPR